MHPTASRDSHGVPGVQIGSIGYRSHLGCSPLRTYILHLRSGEEDDVEGGLCVVPHSIRTTCIASMYLEVYGSCGGDVLGVLRIGSSLVASYAQRDPTSTSTSLLLASVGSVVVTVARGCT
jgi:hypothetical protein